MIISDSEKIVRFFMGWKKNEETHNNIMCTAVQSSAVVVAWDGVRGGGLLTRRRHLKKIIISYFHINVSDRRRDIVNIK